MKKSIACAKKSVELTRKIRRRSAGAWQVAQLARHPQRPVHPAGLRPSGCSDEFDELAGDRAYADLSAIVGVSRVWSGRPVMIIGHQKGRETKENSKCNFGMLQAKAGLPQKRCALMDG